MKVYVIGSLRNDFVPHLGIELRKHGFDCFDDWHSNGREADDRWQGYEQRRGRSFADALKAPVAQNTFGLDKRMLDWCDAAVLVLPAGKSAHMELGYAIGRGKLGYILLDKEPERFDVMYAFAEAVVGTVDELLVQLDHQQNLQTFIAQLGKGHMIAVHAGRNRNWWQRVKDWWR